MLNPEGAHSEYPDGIFQQQKPDYYSTQRTQQPKFEIANYVAAESKLVPRRFATLDAARTSGLPFMIRSEHPQEYDGVSGLLSSYLVDSRWLNVAQEVCEEVGYQPKWHQLEQADYSGNPWWHIYNQIMIQIPTIDQTELEDMLPRLDRKKILRYAELLDIDPDSFMQDISYSYWEYIDGYNRTIVGDNSVPGRYHVFTLRNERNTTRINKYCIIENGRILYIGPYGMKGFTRPFRAGALDAIRLYEEVAQLDRFSRDNRPIMEMQAPLGNPEANVFLQYHRGVDIQPATFTLERPREAGEIEAVYCRGATRPEGETLHLHFPGYYDTPLHIQPQEAAYDMSDDNIYSEIMLRRRRLQLLDSAMHSIAFHATVGHWQRSLLFKTPLAISVKSKDMKRIALSEEQKQSIRETGIVPTVRLSVTSDGRKAYIKQVG